MASPRLTHSQTNQQLRRSRFDDAHCRARFPSALIPRQENMKGNCLSWFKLDLIQPDQRLLQSR
jgi:hypothetical protein